MKLSRTTALILAAGCAAPAIAQDSVSKFVTGLPGDANTEFTSGQAYVVDLVPFTTRSNTTFGIAPIAKASKTGSTFFTSLVSAQTISRSVLTGVAPAAGSYAVWNTPGQGINATNNNPAGSTTAPASTAQFAFAAAEFDGQPNSVFGGIANFDPADPTRLYVKRVIAATNRADGSTTLGTAAIGLGGVDAHGNVVFRADSNLQTGPGVVSGNNIFRISMAARNNAAVNQITIGGAADAAASVHIVNASGTTHGIPNILPQDEGGPAYFGPNFDNQIVRGSAAGITTSDASHRPGGFAQHRGAMAYSKQVLLGTTGAVGSAAVYVRAGTTGPIDTIAIFDIDAAGNPVGTPRAVTLPASAFTTGLNDALDPRVNPFLVRQFDHYQSQTAFQGGISQVAIGKDQQGRILVAATAYEEQPFFPAPGLTNPYNAIIVGRLDTPASAPVWNLAIWNDINSLSGKPIRDENGTQIGRMGGLFEVTGGIPVGPSMSAPAIDSVGNIWFVGVGVFDELAGANPDNALFRAVYDPSAAVPVYTLEAVVDTGNVFAGANSGLNWQLRFIEIADNNSVSSGTFFSQNVAQDGFAGIDVSGLDTMDPRTNGGVILSAGIIYDRNNDGQFDDPVVSGSPTGSVDEEYNVLLYIANITADADPCAAADYNGDTIVDIQDFLDFFGDYGPCEFQVTPCPDALFDVDRYNPDNFVDIQDFLGFFDIFGQCS
ncbi:MAG: hypothetical protein KF838_03540 [Phycisphaeraceae bacterium]|nr:MAG: hypothetical protein KF838_03540 [Phycisphaeraceae bacterium]